MHALAKCGLATVLATSAVVSNLLLTLSVLSSADAQVGGPQPQVLDWQKFQIPEFGTTVDYPAGIFTAPHGKAEKGVGQRLNSADGRSVLLRSGAGVERFAPMHKGLVTLVAAAIVATTFSALPADARAKNKSQHRADTAPSLDGRTTGRPRTCGFDTFQYDGFGVPYGPYCH